MGIKIGPDGKIWYVNATTNEVGRIDGLSVGVKNINKITSVEVYPNPAGHTTYLRISTPLLEDAKVSVYNITGKLIFSSIMKAGESTQRINVENLTSGIYAIKLSSRQQDLNVRFVKE